MGFIRFNEATTSAVFLQGMPAEFWHLPEYGCLLCPESTHSDGSRIPMLLSLVAMNHHFVSDVIAGSVLGGLIAAYAAHVRAAQNAVRTSRLRV